MNLLPQKDQLRIRTEYYARLAVVALFGMSFVFAVGLISLIPVYASLFVREKSALADMTTIQNVLRTEDAGIRAAFEVARKDTALLSRAGESRVSDLISAALKKKTEDIALSNVIYNKEGAAEFVSLSGVAASRTALRSFEKALEGEYAFESVEVPVSNFVRESNIPFTISIRIRKAGETK